MKTSTSPATAANWQWFLPQWSNQGRVSAAPATEQQLPTSLWLCAALAWQTALGSAMYAWSQNRPLLGTLAIIISLASFYLTDVRRWVNLHWVIANGAALVAVFYTTTAFQRFDPEQQLLSIADLLLYLQFVLLFQQKVPRLCWQITVLSFLQVLLGAALTFNYSYGLLLIPYFTGAIWLLVLLNEDRLARVAWTVQQDLPRLVPTGESSTLERGWLGGYLPRWRPEHLRLLTHSLVTSLLVASVIFFTVPRIRSQAWTLSNQQVQSVVGFDDTINLGQVGEVFESPELVFLAKFTDVANQPRIIQGEPLFRGSILNQYYRGNWKYLGWRMQDNEPTPLELLPQRATEVTKQEITIEPLDQPILFHVQPIYLKDSRGRQSFPVRCNENNRNLYREQEIGRMRLNYEVLTTGIVQGRQHPIIPEILELNVREWQQLLQLPARQDIRQMPGDTFRIPRDIPPENSRDNLAVLGQIAQREIAAANLNPDAEDYRFQVARVLERYLKSERFSYTLLGQPRNPEVDPIVDFLTENPRGHCEYFASALALMLRTQNIPARVVVGYKGGDYNQVGGYYQVREMHAHAWVEAYLEKYQVPAELWPPGYENYRAGWLTLDPTTAVRDPQSAFNGLFGGLADLGDYMQMVWNNYIIGMNADRQNQTIYAPLREQWQIFADWMSGQDLDSETMSAWAYAATIVLRWGIVLILAGMGCFGLYQLITWIRRHWRSGKSVTDTTESPSPTDPALVQSGEWWRQLLAIGQQLRIAPTAGQTPREFAESLQATLRATDPTSESCHAPQEIVDCYYQVNYARVPPTPALVDRVEAAFGVLARHCQAIAAPGLPSTG
ncbi:MAG: DUF3488 and transglutaminase-like domain-containing protein [Pirellulales bacterium]|nr:DUF3488 and transglutaminase-like domain-containing protein [Pirellulales bacterium]